VGVYLALSALDFPFCFLAVRMLGTDRIGRWEHNVIDAFWKAVRVPFPDLGKKELEAGAGEIVLDGVAREGGSWGTSGVEQAEADNSGIDASMFVLKIYCIYYWLTCRLGLWTQLALAYAIHKSFIFIRVPLTAAILPKVVKTLRGWGWDIGKRKPKLPKSS
jgi:N-terminal acetyltransferase 2